MPPTQDNSNIILEALYNLYGAAKKTVPINMRQYADAALGDKTPLTESDLWASDLDAIKNAINNSDTSGVIGYGDYGAEPLEFSDWGNPESRGDGLSMLDLIIKSYTDPKFRMETTLGLANVHTDTNGDVVVTDTYNFGATPELLDAEVKRAGSPRSLLFEAYQNHGWEGILNAFGNLYVAPEGDNSIPVRIKIKNSEKD